VEGKDEWVTPMGDPEVSDIVKTEKEEADSVQPQQSKKREPASDTMEIDLHMDDQDLQKSQFSLSGILTLQMSRFHSALDEAISKKCRKLVIIHGVGQGTLKMQIRKELQEKYPEFLFQDASFREYGFGATMVHLIADKKQ
jgi:dsDNA-specific endonuclease/ATPase MutS2